MGGGVHVTPNQQQGWHMEALTQSHQALPGVIKTFRGGSRYEEAGGALVGQVPGAIIQVALEPTTRRQCTQVPSGLLAWWQGTHGNGTGNSHERCRVRALAQAIPASLAINSTAPPQQRRQSNQSTMKEMTPPANRVQGYTSCPRTSDGPTHQSPQLLPHNMHPLQPMPGCVVGPC